MHLQKNYDFNPSSCEQLSAYSMYKCSTSGRQKSFTSLPGVVWITHFYLYILQNHTDNNSYQNTTAIDKWQENIHKDIKAV